MTYRQPPSPEFCQLPKKWTFDTPGPGPPPWILKKTAKKWTFDVPLYGFWSPHPFDPKAKYPRMTCKHTLAAIAYQKGFWASL
jgi:hypothetical protein